MQYGCFLGVSGGAFLRGLAVNESAAREKALVRQQNIQGYNYSVYLDRTPVYLNMGRRNMFTYKVHHSLYSRNSSVCVKV